MRFFRQAEMSEWRNRTEWPAGLAVDSSNDILFYHLDLDIALGSPFLRGNVLVRFASHQPALTQLRLNLHHAFTVDSVTGSASGFSASNDTLVITLDRPYQSGEVTSLTVHYHGVPPLANSTKGLRYTTHAGSQPVIASLSTPFLAHFWWPCKDGPGDKPDSVHIDITVPDTTIAGLPLVAVSNGTLAGTEILPGKIKYRWRETYPIAPYYVMVAISNYDHFQHNYSDSLVQFPIDYYVFSEHRSAAELGVAQLPDAMAFFSSRFGSYPFHREKYGMTQLGYYGAIENQTNTITNNMSLSWFYVSVHELAHMWFGDMITCASWHHGWLNEGFATYAEALWEEHVHGTAAYHNYMMYFQYFGPGTIYLSDVSDPFAIFLPIIYDKGAYTMHMLRHVLGDSVFFESMSAYSNSSAFRFGHATTEDFQQVCENVAGQDLDYFFQQWIYGQNYPTYGFNWTSSPAANGYNVVVRIKQNPNTASPPFFTMPIDVRITTVAGDTLCRVFNDQIDQEFVLNVSHEPSAVSLDPDRWILRQTYVLDVDEIRHPVPSSVQLHTNRPNPFNATTTLTYSLPEPAFVSLVVYNVLGQPVRRLVNEHRSSGRHAIVWNGTDERGRPLSSGVYVGRLHDGRRSFSIKMLLLK